MRPRDLLGVFVRLAGLGFILCALFYVYYVVVKTLGLPTTSTLPVWQGVQGAIVYAVFGFCILAGARLIVQMAYWRDDS
jgi:predicted transporter